MRNITVTFSDGSKHVYQNAPDDITPDAVQARASQEFGKQVAHLDGGRNAPVAPTESPQVQSQDTGKAKMLQGVKDLAGGLVRGAGSIGATLLAPIDIANDAINGKGLSLESNRERRAGIDSGLTELVGSNPENTMYKAGKLGGEIAGTAGIGSLLANGMRAVPVLSRLAPAVASGGFKLGDAATSSRIVNGVMRTAGGATQGAAAAGLVNPEDAATGAVIGGVAPGAVKVAGELGKALSGGVANTLGATTGVGGEAVKAAFDAGKNKSADFLTHLRGKGEFEDVVASAKEGLARMRDARAAQYRSGMVDISNDKTVLDFKPIDDAMNRVLSIGNYKGMQINKNASGVVNEIYDVVNQWKALPKAEYHTPEGLDALKRAIGDIRDATQFGTPARKAADTVYNSVKQEITSQAPTYAKVMRDYSEASKTLEEVTKALSLGEKASADTSIRKLQSLLRNNAQTNYGNRLSLANELEQQGGVSLRPALAGQAMNSWTPRGMVGAIEKGALGVGSVLNPTILAAAPAASPRLVGEAAYGAGRAIGGAGNASKQFTNKLAALLGNRANQATGLLGGAMRVAPVISLSGLANQTAQQ